MQKIAKNIKLNDLIWWKEIYWKIIKVEINRYFMGWENYWKRASIYSRVQTHKMNQYFPFRPSNSAAVVAGPTVSKGNLRPTTTTHQVLSQQKSKKNNITSRGEDWRRKLTNTSSSSETSHICPVISRNSFLFLFPLGESVN